MHGIDYLILIGIGVYCLYVLYTHIFLHRCHHSCSQCDSSCQIKEFNQFIQKRKGE